MRSPTFWRASGAARALNISRPCGCGRMARELTFLRPSRRLGMAAARLLAHRKLRATSPNANKLEDRLAGQAEEFSRQAEELFRSQQALESQTLMLQSVLDSMAEGLVAADEQGKFIIWNPAAVKILGLEAANLPSQQWTAHYGLYLEDMVTPFPTDQLPLTRAIRGESSSAQMFVRNPKLERGTWIEVGGGPLKDKDGAVRGGVVAFRDITRRKADALRALDQDGFEVTADVVQDEAAFTKALRANPPEVVLADYNLPNWKGMDALNVIRREGLDIPMILVSGALGDVTAVECIRQGATDYVLKDGLARLPEVIRRALREKAERSLRRQAEEHLALKVAELARSNDDLEQFAYVASHDLQEPLRMVAAYTQLLAERYRGKLDENADKFIGYASEGAERMQVLIHDLLAFSRVGRKEACESVDCNAVMKDVLQALAAAILESGAVVSHGELPAVWADRTQVAQVFQNLIGNALKFRGIEPPLVSVQAEKTDQQWQFSVSDNGIGIAPEYAESIFVVFQRLHGRSEYPGNGIGLAICKKIIEHNGGKIWVESQAGSGSSFKFTLPCQGRNQGKGAQS